MATRVMYENNPADFLLWYFKRFASYRNVKPNAVHYWLANKKLITQNIDGLDGRAGNKNYISIHGRLDKVVLYQNEMDVQSPFDANWNEIDLSLNPSDEELKKNLLDKFKINLNNNNILSPKLGLSLKPYVLLFDEIYTDLYRISEAEEWMNNADKIIFMGTSFSVNITSIALRTAIANGIEVEIVDPEPIKFNYNNVRYYEMTAEEYCNMRKLD
jgi:NAD-dependent deacetylase